MNKYTKLINNIVSFGNSDDRIVAIVLIGSQARKEKASDEYSDLDLIVIAEDTNSFIQSNDWLEKISKYHISFLEKTVDGADEKRVLFEDALDVDFVIISENDAKTALVSGESRKMLCNGYCVLVDKKGMQAYIPTSQQTKEPYFFPQEVDYINVVNDFWYHAIWTSKKMLRGELWAAKFCLDSYMKSKLLWMLEFYEHMKNGPDYNTWYSGRFVDTWAEQEVRNQLAKSFAHYDKQDMIIALKNTMELFRYLATNIAAVIGYKYCDDVDDYSSKWVEQNLK